MHKFLFIGFVFAVGVALGGGLSYNQVQAQLNSVQAGPGPVSTGGASFNQAGGGSCG